jgi:hypothetical protein
MPTRRKQTHTHVGMQEPRNRALNIASQRRAIQVRRTGIQEQREPKESGQNWPRFLTPLLCWCCKLPIRPSSWDTKSSVRSPARPPSCAAGCCCEGRGNIRLRSSSVRSPARPPSCAAGCCCGGRGNIRLRPSAADQERTQRISITARRGGQNRRNEGCIFLGARTSCAEGQLGGVLAALASRTLGPPRPRPPTTPRTPRTREPSSCRGRARGRRPSQRPLSRTNRAEQFTEHLRCFPEGPLRSPRNEADGTPARWFLSAGESSGSEEGRSIEEDEAYIAVGLPPAPLHENDDGGLEWGMRTVRIGPSRAGFPQCS